MKNLLKYGKSIISGVSHYSVFMLGCLKTKKNVYDYIKDSNGNRTPVLNKEKIIGIQIEWDYFFLFWTITITTQYTFHRMEIK